MPIQKCPEGECIPKRTMMGLWFCANCKYSVAVPGDVWMSVDQFMKHIERFPGPKPTREAVEKLEAGECLGLWKKPSGKWVLIWLQKIWIRRIDMNYRTTKTKDCKGRKARELIISSMPLPKGSITPRAKKKR